MARFPRKQKLTKEESAARVFRVYSENRGMTFHIRSVCRMTTMSPAQVRNGERHLKAFLNEHKDEAGGWALHISLSHASAHGLIKDGDRSFLDAVSRKKYMASRSVSELDYLEQQIARVPDDITRKHLRRGITFERAAAEAYAEAYERMAAEL